MENIVNYFWRKPGQETIIQGAFEIFMEFPNFSKLLILTYVVGQLMKHLIYTKFIMIMSFLLGLIEDVKNCQNITTMNL